LAAISPRFDLEKQPFISRAAGEIGFAPADMYTFYDETPLLQSKIDGTGAGCVGLIEAGDFNDQEETAFNNAFGLPPAVIARILAERRSGK
jgi:hypothetical protein